MNRYWTSDFFEKDLYTLNIVRYLNNLNYQQGILILIFFFALALLINLIFKIIFKSLVGKTHTKLDDNIAKALRLPVFVSTILAGIEIYIQSIETTTQTSEFSSNSLITLALMVWGYAAIKITDAILIEIKNRQVGAEKLSNAIPFLKNVSNITITIVSILAILKTWGVDITPLLASAGVAGVAVAFAAKDTVSNLFGGISIFFDKPYKVGDYVIIQDQYRGEVTQIGTRSTKIRTRDNVLITVPNSVMITQAVINETGFDPRLRIRIPVGISYSADLEMIEEITVEVLKKHKDVLEIPEPRIRYRKFGDSAIEFEAIAFISKPADKGLVTHELIKEIDKKFKEEKIDIPYPQMDVHLSKE